MYLIFQPKLACEQAVRTTKKLHTKSALELFFRLDYVPYEVTRRSPKAAELYVPPDGTMMFASTYAEDYKKHPVQKFIVKKQAREYCPPATQMVAMSIYKGWCCTVSRSYQFNI